MISGTSRHEQRRDGEKVKVEVEVEVHVEVDVGVRRLGQSLTLLEPQYRFGDTPVKFQVLCPQNGTAVLNGIALGWGEVKVEVGGCI